MTLSLMKTFVKGYQWNWVWGGKSVFPLQAGLQLLQGCRVDYSRTILLGTGR
ncbi:hypothetical protein K438DRAFT_1853542 [Mycena galopus ATCC 62051]|nr:hypothetical protein K438DRAFT_1853542 [Mycena galopus ATCC 62051]